MEDRWPYPVSQAMQRQTGSGHKATRPAASAPSADKDGKIPRGDGHNAVKAAAKGQSSPCQIGRQPEE